MGKSCSVEAIAKISKYLNLGCKLRIINKKQESVFVEIIKGIDFSSDPPTLLIDKVKFRLTTEIDAYLTNLDEHTYYKPRDRGVILIDVVGYSKYDTLAQNAILTTIKRAVLEQLRPLFVGIPFNPILQIIPTGDGFYFVCDENINDRFHNIGFAIFSAMHVMQNRIIKESGRDLKSGNRIELRVGCYLGECDFFIDLAGNKNCYGIAMNEAARVLSYGQKEAERKFNGVDTSSSLFLSSKVFQQSKPLIDYMNKDLNLQVQCDDLGLVADKHGIERKIWWIRNINRYSAFRIYSTEECIKNGWM